MSANLSSLSMPAAPAAKLALNGANESSSGPGGPAAAGDGNPFAALYQQLLGKQGLQPAVSPLLTLPAGDSNEAAPAETQENLAAVLPFLEAMGLTQTAAFAKDPGDLETTDKAHPEVAPESIIAAITPQVVRPPAISAVKPDQASTTNTAAAEESLAALTSEAPATIEIATPASPPSAKAATAHDEFASQLAVALEASNETLRHPGNSGPHGAVTAPTPHEHVTTTPSLPVSQAVGSAAWSDAVGNQVVWMANRMENRAELVLTPPQMGRVEISLSVTGDNATASFISANPVVREALEAAMPRLREVLADAGIQLGQAQVGAENARQFAQHQDREGSTPGEGLFADAPERRGLPISAASPTGLKFGRGLVDVFA